MNTSRQDICADDLSLALIEIKLRLVLERSILEIEVPCSSWLMMSLFWNDFQDDLHKPIIRPI